MQTTKERIMLVALKQFSIEGYEAVSVRDIAKELGMTQSALYKHYANKKAIFDRIVEHMGADYTEHAREVGIPSEHLLQIDQSNVDSVIEHLTNYCLFLFTYWTKDEFASDFRKMLSLEQYCNPEIRALYQQYLGEGILEHLENIFSQIISIKQCEQLNPKLFAHELYATIYMMIHLYDCMNKKEYVATLINDHVNSLMNALK